MFGPGAPQRAGKLAILFGSGTPQRASKLAIEWLCRRGWRASWDDALARSWQVNDDKEEGEGGRGGRRKEEAGYLAKNLETLTWRLGNNSMGF